MSNNEKRAGRTPRGNHTDKTRPAQSASSGARAKEKSPAPRTQNAPRPQNTPVKNADLNAPSKTRRRTPSAESAAAPKTQSRAQAPAQQRPVQQKPAPQRTAQQRISPRTQTSAPRTQTPAPRSQTPAQRTQTPAPHSRTPVQRTQTPAPRTQAPTQRTQTPAPRSQASVPRTQAPASRPQTGKRRVVAPAPAPHAEKPTISAMLQLVGKKPPTMRSRASQHPGRMTLRMIPLGGMCEIGKNMTAYEYGGDIIIVDCGQIFPDETMPGVDAVIPDFTYVLQNRDRVRGIFVTHGHEDHIGGLPYLLREFKAPVYGGRMTIELLRYKLDDRVPGLGKSCELHEVHSGNVVRAGCFSVEFIHVNHSIADAFMFAIRTPIGVVMHSGDFKIDYTPINGEIMDLQRIAQYGREGVLLFVCESTNIEVPGFSKSERRVGESMAQMFEGAQGRIFVATFSSNVSRLQQIFTAAELHGRKVCLVGRSMLNVFNAANNLGYIKMKPDTLIDAAQAESLPPEQVVILSTGSQGEEMSALTRIAFSTHREIEIKPGDTVIISATPIPGNEKPIYKVINELYRRGAKVYYSALADVHVSGHASQEEIKLVHSLVRPRYFIPAHGETRMLYQHAELAHRLGVPFENIFILANGDIFEITSTSGNTGRYGRESFTAHVSGFTSGEAVLIDGASVGEVDNTVLRERKLLSGDGVVAVSLAVSRRTGGMLGQPAVSAMGFLYESEHEKIEAACRQQAATIAERIHAGGQRLTQSGATGQLQSQLRSYLFERTKRRPVVLLNLIEID